MSFSNSSPAPVTCTWHLRQKSAPLAAGGIEKGEKLGYDKKSREMAKTMKKEGEPIEKISRYTGLSKEEIEMLEP